jgi:uncharacterized protein DUF3303
MKQLYVTIYEYRDGLDEDDLRDLTKRFVEFGQASGVTAHYSRLDGQGGIVVQEIPGDPEQDFELVTRYSPWVNFQIIPVTTIEEAFPVIQRVYG